MSTLNQENEALQDIAARPDVSQGAEDDSAQEQAESAQDTSKQQATEQDFEPDHIEQVSGRIIAKTLDKIRERMGLSGDDDMKTLISEMAGAFFAAMRMMAGRPWMRFVVGGVAFSFAGVPYLMDYMAKKRAEQIHEVEE